MGPISLWLRLAAGWAQCQLPRFDDDEEGQGLVEYGLIIVLVSIVVVVALTALGAQLNSIFNNITGKLNV